MPPKRTTSKSPAPKATTTASASPVKASPKRASSSAAAKKQAVPSKKQDETASNVSDDLNVDEDGATLVPQTQNQLTSSQTSKQSPSPASGRAPSPKKSAPASVIEQKPKQQQQQKAQEDEETTKASIRAERLAATHENPKAKEATLEAAKRCNKLGVAVHSVYDYLKKKAAESAKNTSTKSSSSSATTAASSTTTQQQQDSLDDVLALFGPQKNSSGVGALTTQNEKLQQSIAENNGVPVTQVAVEFSFIRAPQPNRIPWSVVLPNDVHDIEKSICLITPAPQEKHRMLIEGETNNAKDAEDFVQAPANIQKIMGIDKLEGRFKDPVALRALAKSYSAFWIHNECDHFPRVLAGEFMSHHFPVWVNGKKSLHINERLQRTLGCVMIPRQGHDNVTVVVGHTKQTEAQLAENIRTFCGNVVALLDESWKDVLSIRLSFKDFGSDRRIVLPIYAHDFRESHGLGSANVVAPKIKKDLPTLARMVLDSKKESGKIRQRNDEEEKKEAKATEAKKKPSNSAAATTSAAPPAPAPGGKKSVTTAPAQQQKVKEDAAVVEGKKSAKKDDDKKEDSDDDDIPQIDASPASAAKKKPAPKGKKVGGKK